MTPEYDVLDLSLRNLSLYSFTLGVIGLSLYNKVKVFFKKKKNEETGRFELIDWKNELIPFIFAILIVYSFYPVSFFSYLPFVPKHPVLDVVYTALIISSTAQVEYSGAEKFGHFFSSLIGRVMKTY